MEIILNTKVFLLQSHTMKMYALSRNISNGITEENYFVEPCLPYSTIVYFTLGYYLIFYYRIHYLTIKDPYLFFHLYFPILNSISFCQFFLQDETIVRSSIVCLEQSKRMTPPRYFGQDTVPFCKDIERSLDLFAKFKTESPFHPNCGRNRAEQVLKGCNQ